MAANAEAEQPQRSPSTSKSKKHKKKKSKAASASKPNGNPAIPNGALDIIDNDAEDDNAQNDNAEELNTASNASLLDQTMSDMSTSQAPPSTARRKSSAAVNGQRQDAGADLDASEWAPSKVEQATGFGASDATSRLDAAVKERELLRNEVTELRKELEGIQQKHSDDTEGLRRQLEDTRKSKEQSESKYQKLLGQVNNIKTQLGERLKADAAELEQAKEHIGELESERATSRDEKLFLESQVTKLKSENSQQAKEIDTLRGRTNLSQQNWAKERDDLVSREASAREEFEAARQAMQDWEVLAQEERSLREGLSERVAELEDQLSTQKEAYDRAVSECDSQSSTVDGLQRALKEVHDARKEERRELVESSQAQHESLRQQLNAAETSLKEAQESVAISKAEIERLGPLEKEVKEKSLLIGKLRHEAVILNDHLTKALRFLKRAKPDDTVDRSLVTNHFLHFLALDRSDPKKFQILQLISALLGWSEEQKEQAGLARPGATSNTSNLKVPLSAPFRRVSSSTGLSPLSPSASESSPNASLKSPPLGPSSFGTGSSSARGEGLAELWSDFLEREAEEGQRSRGGSVRVSSGSSTPQLKGQNAPPSPTTSNASSQINLPKTRLDSVGEDEGAK